MAPAKRGKSRRKVATRGRGRSRGKSPRKAGGRPGARSRLAVALRFAAVIAFVVGFGSAGWVSKLDRVVISRFEGRRFSVPSKVLAAPTILYPGLDATHLDLRGTLERLGYRPGPPTGRLEPGQLRWSPGRVHVFLREFEHPTRSELPREVGIRIAEGRIRDIRELPSGREAAVVLLEPDQVGAFYGDNREQRELVRVEDVPRELVDAILAVEDRRFETHHGIDPRRIAGAVLANLRAGGIREGGSTLTQQLVKNFFLTPERTLSRKLQEAVMSLLVEARYDKPQILQAYLNEIYLGQRGATAIHGVGEAAHFFFGKSATSLSLAESAMIAAVIQSPNRLSPHRNAQEAVERRNLVLRLMRAQGRIHETQLRAALAEPLRVAAISIDGNDTRYFLDLLRRQLPEVYDSERLADEGLRIYSTLDPRLQRAAAAALRRGIERVEARLPARVRKAGKGWLEGCLIALRPQTGEVLALVGGRDYRVSQFNRCTQARRQVGSAFKPFVYLAALEARRGGPVITLASFLDDSPLTLDTPAGSWEPQNYDRAFRGRVSVREAIERSLNVPAVRLGQRVGIDRVVAMARRLGITSPLPSVPSLALGTAEISPLEMARAYGTLANAGVRPWPHTFEDVVSPAEGTLERRKLRLERVLDTGTSYLMTSMLEGVVDRGTASRVRAMGMRGPIAGKTGTTDGERDLWFVGYTPELVAVVWLGFDEPRSVGVPSSIGALPIWVDFMRAATGSRVRGQFLAPPELVRLDIHPPSGAVARFGCPERRSEYFLRGTEPDTVCPSGARKGDQRGWLDWLRRAM